MVITFLPRSKRLLISWLQSPSEVILEPPKIKSVTVSTVSPSICHEVKGSDAMILVFWMLSFKPAFSFSSFTFNQRLVLLFLFTFYHKGGDICISEVIDTSLGNLDSSSCFIEPGISHDVFAYKLNKQDDNIQPWHTAFLIRNQSVVPHPVLTVASWPTHRFLRRQVRWSASPISFRIFHSLLWSTQSKALAVNKAEIDVCLKLSCFFDDPTGVGNLISGSSAFPKPSLNISKFTVHVLLKPALENFEHYFTGVWDECNCAVVWAFFGIAFLWHCLTPNMNAAEVPSVCSQSLVYVIKLSHDGVAGCP